MALSFTSLEFIIFLALCLALLRGTRRFSIRKWLLILLSYLFYVSFGTSGILVLTLTALLDFIVGRRLANSVSAASRKGWLCLGIAVNLGPLVYLKYSAFLAEILATALQTMGLRSWLPMEPVFTIAGLSYFTFAGMSYVLDVYNETIEPAQSVSDFLCYLVYFPKLIAGPIVRATEFLPQLRNGFQATAEDFELGCAYLLVGAVKKLVIADQLASHVGMILVAPHNYNAFTLAQGIVGYGVQIYTDFSGYSDMAIGCARLMGIRFPQNFLMPYSAVNIAEFWRRWHVTMSSWFRDYVFIPLELGSRGAKNVVARAARNIVITMLLCGLWHGGSWNFVLWGGVHGVALAVYQVYSRIRRQERRGTQSAFGPGVLVSRVLTLSVVLVGWIFFGTQNVKSAFNYLWRLVTWSKDGVALESPYILPLTALVVIVHLIVNKDRNLIEELVTYSVSTRLIVYSTLLLALGSLVSSDAVPFVYARF